ncbi:MAG: hypothetical protein JOZ42_03840 [Acetobacteraceae bacterium]|nr:hypothetical protein [Acetobacteraceae bacterium]
MKPILAAAAALLFVSGAALAQTRALDTAPQSSDTGSTGGQSQVTTPQGNSSQGDSSQGSMHQNSRHSSMRHHTRHHTTHHATTSGGDNSGGTNAPQ